LKARLKLRWLAEGTGTALLLLLPYYWKLLLPGYVEFYHHRLPISSITHGLALDLAAFSVAAALVIALATRLPGKLRTVVATCGVSLIGWRAMGIVILVFGWWRAEGIQPNPGKIPPLRFAWVGTFWESAAHPMALVLLLGAGLLAWKRPGLAENVGSRARMGLMAFSFCALWILPQLAWEGGLSAEAVTLRRAAGEAHAVAGSQAMVLQGNNAKALVPAEVNSRGAGGRRIVWILLDELSYDLIFDHPVEGQSYPHLEHLRSESVSFGDLSPIGFRTDRIIPALFLGKPFEEIRSTAAGEMQYRDEADHRWVRYDGAQTLMGQAWRAGWNPAVAGWYNPYCRLFARVTASCSWRPGIMGRLDVEDIGLSGRQTTAANALAIPRFWIEKALGRTDAERDRTELLNRNIADYQGVMTDASQLIRNGDLHFVFLHLPVPHPPGIYDRRRHCLRAGGDYLDNLVLADDTVGNLLQQIDATPWAPETTVIVSSDHSWRVAMWKMGNDWTREEETVSQDQYETRPVLLIRFPGSQAGRKVDEPMSEMIEHDLIAAMLRGEIKSQEDLESYLAGQRNLEEFAR
jgi:hypothetical protein